MGGWRADGSSSAPPHEEPSPARSRRASESRGFRSERSGGARRDLSTRWAEAMRPVKDAAALGRNGADALRDAVLRFFADIEARGVPSTADLDTRACASDVLTLVRAANGCAETPRSEDGKDDSGALRRGVDALVADLVAADALALDAEVVAVLCAYYVSRLEAARAARDPAGASSSSATSSDKNAADAYKAVAALARTGGSAFFPDAETESLVALAIGDLRAFVTEKDSRRAVLDALGAVVGRVPASALSARSHADVGEALAGLLDELEAPSSGRPSSGPGPSADPRSVRAYALPFSSDHTLVLEESVAASRYYAALWRCAHLCASRDGARWPEPVVARLAGRVRRFLSFGVESASPAETSATATATASVVSSARGYVPPHARDDGYSDSDASDAETSARERSYGDRFGSSRVRANAASCVASLARADPRSVHSSWPALLPTSAAHYVRSAVTRRRGSSRVPFTLARVVLHDPSPRARAAAAAAVAQLFDSAASRQYLSAAETKLDAKTGLAARRVNFASLSSTLGDLAVATHGALTLAVAAEPALACVPSACKASAALADAAPFARLPRNLLPDAALAAWRRVSSLVSGMTSAEDSETATAVVALLSALAATLGAEGAPARFRDALVPVAVPGTERRERSGEDASPVSEREREPADDDDRLDLRVIIPGLASLAGDVTLAVAVRCEAFGALRAAAATHTAAVAAHWRDARVRAALPGAMFAPRNLRVGVSDHPRLLSADEKDRTAHASARFLSEYLLAAGGGGAAAALSASAGDDDADGFVATETLGTASGRRGVAKPTERFPKAFALPEEGSVALWTSVAAEHLPAMVAHASPLVRASGVGALGGLTAEALRGVSAAHRAVLTETPRALTRSDDSANVRAAACRAVGASASLYGTLPESSSSDEKNTIASRLASDAALLVAAMRDGAKSVRLPASWAVANVCGSAAARARLRREAGSSVDPSQEANADDATLSLLAEACVDAATREGDKVRANAARALGHVLAAADFGASPPTLEPLERRPPGRVAEKLRDIAQALMSCLATGNAKTQWNACRAVRELFANETIANASASACDASMTSTALRMCLMLVRDARHFKLRAHAAATLAAPQSREAFGNAYADVLSVVAAAAEQTFVLTTETSVTSVTSVTETNVTVTPHDPDALRHAPRLAARLAATLLRVAALGRAEDAASARDALLKKRGTFRRVALEARRALEEEAARERSMDGSRTDDALPEDPFGTARASAEKKKKEARLGTDANARTHEDESHDDVAVGGPRRGAEVNGAEANGSGVRPAETCASSLDVSALAEALSPSKSEIGSASNGLLKRPNADDARDDARGPSSEIAAAAAGLRRMYAALGGEANDAEAGFYERLGEGEDTKEPSFVS